MNSRRPEQPGKTYEVAFTVISEMSARLLPSTVPRVEIQTNRLDVGEVALTPMVLVPGRSAVGGVSAAVSSRLAGLGVEADRI